LLVLHVVKGILNNAMAHSLLMFLDFMKVVAMLAIALAMDFIYFYHPCKLCLALSLKIIASFVGFTFEICISQVSPISPFGD
jgi:hypothetical protein